MATPPEAGHSASYQELRPLLFSIAYRMTGSVSDAEDIVQEAFLGLTRAVRDGTEVESPKAYLAAATTRQAINHLRSARVRREAYVGTWLPEPLVAGPAPRPLATPDPAEHAELADSLSMAFLVMLESLSPLERAVLLLREVFGYEYGEVAQIVGKSEQNCRQILARARQHIGDRRPRFASSRAQGEELARRFFAAAAGGEMGSLLQVLAPDVVFYGDGGGKALAVRQPLRGQVQVARFIAGLFRRGRQVDVRLTQTWVNGQPGAVALDAAGQVICVFALDIADGAVQAIRNVINPDKLSHLGPVSAMAVRPGEDQSRSRAAPSGGSRPTGRPTAARPASSPRG
jgi:RNA polymerase sigma-70 factor (TIGR02957 family)